MKRLIITIIVLATIQNVRACLMTKVVDNGHVWVGNNEDWTTPNNYIYTEHNNGGIGVVYFAYSDFNFLPQGAVNTEGLVFDWLSTPTKNIQFNKDKPHEEGWARELLQSIMRTCSTVSEVEKILETKNLDFLNYSQIMFVDAKGKSIIIEGDSILQNNSDFSVCTNFTRSTTSLEDISCKRYKKANSLAESNRYDGKELIRNILLETKQSSTHGATMFSQIYDLKGLSISLYLFHDFEHEMNLSIDSLVKQDTVISISSLFPKNKQFEAFAVEYNIARNAIDGISDVETLYELKHLLSLIARNPKIKSMDFDIIEAGQKLADRGEKEMVDELIMFIRKEYTIGPGFEKALASLKRKS
ncbi:MAG: hypothetical protein MK066_10075 [Crocinitomicaceae bacterium]|nr:hypothetical protein [Crocinitomicaceae bacterium]